jgi:hypothetical protein
MKIEYINIFSVEIYCFQRLVLYIIFVTVLLKHFLYLVLTYSTVQDIL